MGGGWSAPRPGRITPRKDPVPIVWAGWASGPVWTGAENLAYTGIRSPDRPARSETLYRLSYLGRYQCTVQLIKCCPWWWTNDCSKHVEPFNEKIKTIHKNLCIPLVYVHSARIVTHNKIKNKIYFASVRISPLVSSPYVCKKFSLNSIYVNLL